MRKLKSIQALIDEIKALLGTKNIDVLVSEIKCFDEELEVKNLLEIIKADLEFEIHFYYVEEIQESKDKILFLLKIEEIKNLIIENQLPNSTGFVDVESEMVDIDRDYFIEKIILTGERR